MKIENGKAIFENEVCWECKGTKKVKRYTLCPLWNKPVNRLQGKVCPHCKAKNKHSHVTVGEYIIDCSICNATGILMQTVCSHLSQDIWNEFVPKFKWSLQRRDRDSTFNESYLGLGIVLGVTDWGQMSRKTDAEIMSIVPTSDHPIQYISFVNKDTLTVATEMIIVIRRDGWAVYPKWA